jgi:radical SAM protein with 4Fe4S-binding SPASM domain
MKPSKTFCIMPWIHLHAFPDGRAYPCCLSEYHYPVGNLKKDTIEQVWNQEPMKRLRRNMLAGEKSRECSRCYEIEDNGMVSHRQFSNASFKKFIPLADDTKPDGTYEDFKIRYYDIRFSNLCNFRCRSCGSIFSSNWYEDEIALWGRDPNKKKIMIAGRTKDDMWEQMQQHIPHLEQIYFAGGEPLIMEEHYRVLRELVLRGRTDVNLVYNTNFSELVYKNQDVLEIWKEFNTVSIGASLDAEGARAEYIRKGTVWNQIVENRQRMMKICPNVDFYVSSTVSLLNVWHLPDFHRNWAEQGLIRAKDWNINMLQSPSRMRVNVLPDEFKQRAKEKLTNHLEWLAPQDTLGRATQGFQGILQFLDQPSDQPTLVEFFKENDAMDQLRGETLEQTFPELDGLRAHVTT